MKTLILVLALGLSTLTTAAQTPAKTLVSVCKGHDAATRTGCAMFLVGWAEGVFTGSLENSPTHTASFVTGDADQMKDVFLGYMAAHPEYGDDEAGSTLMECFRQSKMVKTASYTQVKAR